jgi:two-component system OmpR family response regulator
VLVVEDDAHIRDLVVLHLQLEGLTAVAAGDGADRLAPRESRPVRSDRPRRDAAGLDGVTVCRAIRREPHLNGRADPDADRAARRVGQGERPRERRRRLPDQAVRRPRVHRARARAAAAAPVTRARRTRPGHVAGGLTVDPARRHARLDDREIELTAHEFDLLYVLASNRGIVFSRDALVQRSGAATRTSPSAASTRWSSACAGRSKRSRRAAVFVLTVWGTGYKFADV